MRRQLVGPRHFALTWAIDVDHGGMTAALLRRSRLFASSGAPVDVLTFDDDRDYAAVSQQLRDRGSLDEGVRILNLWSWLEGVPGRSAPRTRVRYADDGTTVLQTDHLRGDGSLLVTDRRDLRRPGVVGGRRVTLFDETGTTVRHWKSKWAFYRYWLDQLAGDAAAVMIADSKTISPFLATYRRRHVLTGHVVHGSHLADDGVALRPSRRATIERLDQFDFVVTLTERQRADLRSLCRPAFIATVPNPVSVPAAVELDRTVNRGVVLSSLSSRKRVAHAIEAVNGFSGGVRLDVYGDGPQRGALAEGAGAGIRFHGHHANASHHLQQHSFLLLTSRSEGSPLAITEAMAAGCIPIAYDIPYGPADLIDHNHTGFLVPEGDIAGLEQSIRTLTSLDPQEVRRMREACRDAARQFNDLTILNLWQRMLSRAWHRKVGFAGRARRYLRRRFQPRS